MRSNARHEGLNRRVRLIINRAYSFHSAGAALALAPIMVTSEPSTASSHTNEDQIL